MSRLLIPNTCQVPNVLFDEVMPRLRPGALRVLLAIVRFTYGFQKHSDKISFSQLQKATGLSRWRVNEALKDLGKFINIKHGAKGRGANEYSLNLDISTGQLVTNSDQSHKVTSHLGSHLKRPSQTHSKPIPFPKGKGASKTQPTDPRVLDLIKSFSDKYEKVSSKPYSPVWGKEGRLLKRLLASSNEAEQIVALMDVYFADDFYAGNGFDIGGFVSAFNRLNSANGRQIEDPIARTRRIAAEA